MAINIKVLAITFQNQCMEQSQTNNSQQNSADSSNGDVKTYNPGSLSCLLASCNREYSRKVEKFKQRSRQERRLLEHVHEHQPILPVGVRDHEVCGQVQRPDAKVFYGLSG